MLTSISPLGERGRGHRWGVTVGWLAVGHAVGGAVLGGLMAAGAAALDTLSAHTLSAHTLSGGAPTDGWRAAVVIAVAALTRSPPRSAGDRRKA